MTRDVLDAIPAGMKSTGQIGVLIPGVTSTNQDVGGTQFSGRGPRHSRQPPERGRRRSTTACTSTTARAAAASSSRSPPTTRPFRKWPSRPAGSRRRAKRAACAFNLVPRDGGNTFKGLVLGAYTDHHLQSDNLNDGLKARGLTSATTRQAGLRRRSRVRRTDHEGPAVVLGLGTARRRPNRRVAGIYYNLTPTGPCLHARSEPAGRQPASATRTTAFG